MKLFPALLFAVGAAYVIREAQRAKPAPVFIVPNVLPPYRAMTVPPFGVFIAEKWKDDQPLMDHEAFHWQQYLDMGLIPFYGEYLSQFASMGYDAMPMEIEARRFAGQPERGYSDIYHRG